MGQYLVGVYLSQRALNIDDILWLYLCVKGINSIYERQTQPVVMYISISLKMKLPHLCFLCSNPNRVIVQLR